MWFAGTVVDVVQMSSWAAKWCPRANQESFVPLFSMALLVRLANSTAMKKPNTYVLNLLLWIKPVSFFLICIPRVLEIA